MLFDLNRKNSDLYKYSSYRKCAGLLLANDLRLPVVKRGAIIDHAIVEGMEQEQLTAALGSVVLCRPDAPAGLWHHLPRGRDLEVVEISKFYSECNRSERTAILLCMQHPSVLFTGTYKQRYEVSGGVCIRFDWLNSVLVEYVGPGFDVGELSRGFTNAHFTVEASWGILMKGMPR